MHRIVWLLALSSCVPPQPQSSYAGQQQGQPQGGEQGQQGQQAAAGLSCIDLMTCFQGCTEGTCIQTCLGQATPETQATASAMFQCGSTNCDSQGGDCLEQQCHSEMEACRASGQVASAPQQQPQYQPPQQEQQEQLVYADQPHTTANLLPWMTGEWIGTRHQFTFWADGRVRRASGVPLYSKQTGNYKCVSTINEIGTVRQEGDILIMEFEPAGSNHCGDKGEAAQGLTVRYQITWYKYSTLPTNLLLVGLDCEAGPGNCNDQMRRR